MRPGVLSTLDRMCSALAKDEASPTGNQQSEKYALQREQRTVQGSCFWDAASAANNVEGYRDVLASGIFRYPSLMPLYKFIDSSAPDKVKGVRVIEEENGNVLVWLLGKKADKEPMDAPHRYVVYAFAKGEKKDLDDMSKVLAVTSKTFYKLPKELSGEYTFVVTVLDRMQNESKGVKCKVKL